MMRVDFKFEHADYYDLALVLVGILAAVGSGTIVPLMSVRWVLINVVHSHWSRNVEAWLSLVESVAGASSLMP